MSNPLETTGILFTDWSDDASAGRAVALTSVFSPLLGKPLLQRSLETLVKLGCRKVHVLLGDSPLQVRELLDSGERWGVAIIYHYRNSEQDLAGNLKHLNLQSEVNYWVASAHSVVPPNTPHSIGAWCWMEDGIDNMHWTGYGSFSGSWLNDRKNTITWEDLERDILNSPVIAKQQVTRPWSCHSDADFLRSNIACLAEQANSGIAIFRGRGSIVHASAKIEGPAYIGNMVRVEANTYIGPNIIINEGVVIDQGASLRHSVILPDTYVGIELDLHEAIAAPGQLASITNGVLLKQLEPKLLASVRGPFEAHRPTWSQRVGLFAFRVSLWPLYGIARLAIMLSSSTSRPEYAPNILLMRPDSQGGGTQTVAVANTSSAVRAGHPGAWIHHFVHTFYPGLNAVARGQLTLSGPELREQSLVHQLPDYWRELYQRHPCGLLNEALFMPPEEGPSPSYFACDAYAAANNKLDFKLQLCWKYLRLVGRQCRQQIFNIKQSKAENSFQAPL
jgi:hypothetical protein